jgi:hypothetical protein
MNQTIFFFTLLLISISSIIVAQPKEVACFDRLSLENVNLFPPRVKNERAAIFLGESHGIDINYSLYEKMIKELNSNNNFRTIIYERSYAEGFLFNKYLETDDENYLKYDVTWCEEMRSFFKEIYSYNQMLPKNEKLRFLGIDAVHSLNPFVLFLQTIIPPDKNVPPEIQLFIDSLRRIQLPIKAMYNSSKDYIKKMDQAVNHFKREISKNKVAYMSFFGKDFSHVMAVINSESTYLEPGNRNKEMYNNILYHLKLDTTVRGIMGWFGTTHLMDLLSTRESMATLLNQKRESPFFGSVINIFIQYENSESGWSGKPQRVESTIKNFYGKEEASVTKALRKGVMCDNFFIEITDDFPKLSKHCDYMIFVKNGKPTTQINLR